MVARVEPRVGQSASLGRTRNGGQLTGGLLSCGKDVRNSLEDLRSALIKIRADGVHEISQVGLEGDRPAGTKYTRTPRSTGLYPGWCPWL